MHLQATMLSVLVKSYLKSIHKLLIGLKKEGLIKKGAFETQLISLDGQVEGMPFLGREVAQKDLGRPCEISSVNHKYLHSYIFKINILMRIACFLKMSEC